MTSPSDRLTLLPALLPVPCWVVFPKRATDRVVSGRILAIRLSDFGVGEYLVLFPEGPCWVAGHFVKGEQAQAEQWLEAVDAMTGDEEAA